MDGAKGEAMRRHDSLAPGLPFDGWEDGCGRRRPRMTRAQFQAWLVRARIPFDPQRQTIIASNSVDVNTRGWRIVSRLELPRPRMVKVEQWTHGTNIRRRAEAADRHRG